MADPVDPIQPAPVTPPPTIGALLAPSNTTLPVQPTGFKAIIRHIVNWKEGYVILPLCLLAVIGAAKFVYWLTGSPSRESPEWIVGFAFRAVCCIVAVVLTSIYKEQVGMWISKEEAKLHVKLAIANKVETIAVVLAFLYVLMR